MLYAAELDGDDEDATYLGPGDIESAFNEDFSNERVDMHYTMSMFY